ncbi:MAG: agmatinase [Kiritimatiellia bacterium]
MLKEQEPVIHEGIRSSYSGADLVVVGYPYDGTVSGRDGARMGPKHVQNEMDFIETWSPYLKRDLLDCRICDLGSMPLSYGTRERVVSAIKEEAELILADGKKILGVGGEHLISLGLIQACATKHRNLNIIHFDAHADLRDDYMGEKLSHATVMRRALEELRSGSLWQFGIRSGAKDEFDVVERRSVMHCFDLQGIAGCLKKIGGDPVYLTVDLDVLDPSVFPGTGTPEPGGITYKELLAAFVEMRGVNIVGADIVELAPLLDASGASTAVACKTLREMSLLMV